MIQELVFLVGDCTSQQPPTKHTKTPGLRQGLLRDVFNTKNMYA